MMAPLQGRALARLATWLCQVPLAAVLLAPRPIWAGLTQRVPDSQNPDRLSADGRYVAYVRQQTLVDPPPPAVLVLDRLTGVETTVAPVTVNGNQGLALSANGRVVAFATGANLLPPDANGTLWDIYVKDLDTGELSRASVSSSGEQSDAHSGFPALSADGRYVAFSSAATNLVPGDTNGRLDVFVRDRVTGVTERVNVASDGSQSSGDLSTLGGSPPLLFCHCPAISSDGRFVAFWSFASDLVPGDHNNNFDAFVHDRLTGETTRVSVRSDGGESMPFVGPLHLGMSGNGRSVAFESRTDDLDPRKTTPRDVRGVFVHDRATGVTELVSLNDAGESANDHATGDPHLTFDGRFVTFVSTADNLVPDDTNGQADIFVRDRLLGTTARVNVTSSGEQGGGFIGPENGPFQLSDDGRFAAFSSPTSLDPSPTFGVVYVRDQTCGDGVIAASERCDDGNLLDGDGCDATCLPTGCPLSFCGDREVTGCESCEAATVGDPDCCTADCRFAAAGAPCDHDGACTRSTCSGDGACVVTPAPEEVCRGTAQPGSSSLRMLNLADDARDQLTWRWTNGAATTLDEFRQPLLDGRPYTFCVFAGTASASRVLVAAETPAADPACRSGTCWKDNGRRLRYRSPSLAPSGVARVTLRPDANGRSAIVLRAGGPLLSLPALGDVGPDAEVTVQLRDGGGGCWGAAFSPPFARFTNTRLEARSN